MTYIEQARAGLLEHLGENEEAWATDEALLDLYTLLVLVKGPDVTWEDVHDAWAIARQRSRPDHPDLVPFDLLTDKVKEYDLPFSEAIKRAGAVRYLGGPS